MATGDAPSVIIPAYDEGMRLIECIKSTRVAIGAGEYFVVAFAESATVRDAARAEGVEWIESPRACRGLQLRLGAAQARGRHMVFVHADSRLPAAAGTMIRDALGRPGVAGGAFRLRFDRAHPVLDLLSAMSRITVPSSFLGDQVLFCTRTAYEAAGGFREHPLFEDVDLSRRLAGVGRLVRLPAAVTTSARRFTENGPFRQVTRNAFLMIAYHAGVSPERLNRWYASAKPAVSRYRASAEDSARARPTDSR